MLLFSALCCEHKNPCELLLARVFWTVLRAMSGQVAIDLSSDDDDDESHEVSITIANFQAKIIELASTMEHSRHVKGGWGNVLNAGEALVARAAHQGSDVITLNTLRFCVGLDGMPGPGWDRQLKPVHRWVKQVIETGHCDYIDHIVAKGP